MSFKKYRDLILGVAMLLFSGFYLYFAQQIQVRPKLIPSYASARIMPELLGSLLAILSVICIIQGIIRLRKVSNEEQEKTSKSDLLVVLLTFAIIIVYTILMPLLGFCLSTIIYLFFQMIILAPVNKRKYLLFAIIAVLFTAVVFVAFRIGLQMLLPRGIIESLLGF